MMQADAVQTRYNALRTILAAMGDVVVGYSGGVDSTLLVKVAADTLGDRALAVIGRSVTYPTREFEEATRLAQSIGVSFRVVDTEETDVVKFRENPPDRCYYCKTELFGKLAEIAAAGGFHWIADGTIVDDTADFRPGMKAKTERDVRSPLLEAGFTKNDVRELSRILGLPTWDKPSFACLSSRFPYGTGITPEALAVVDEAETFLRDLGFRAFRVRYHDRNTARIEASPGELHRLLDDTVRLPLIARFKALGFIYVTVDLQGYRTGSMNEVLSADVRLHHTR
jgi:pyridinium-3,5-biscarboxylic acid mononucleotide sulfurtransferase